MSKYWIINLETKTYIETEAETFDGEWKENYQHTRGAKWVDVFAAHVWDYDMSEGLYFTYDLCCDGMIATLYADVDQTDAEQIKRAKEKLRSDHDVVSLHVMRLKRAESVSCPS